MTQAKELLNICESLEINESGDKATAEVRKQMKKIIEEEKDAKKSAKRINAECPDQYDTAELADMADKMGHKDVGKELDLLAE